MSCGEPCDGCANRAEHHLCDACCHDEVDAIQKENRELREKLGAARAEVERLRNALAAISLDEYESTSSASEKVHGHARIARKALYGEKP